MSIERYPQHEQDPLKLGPQLPTEVLELRRDETATLDSVMIPQDQASEKWGINGDVLGVVELPVNPESQDDMVPPEGQGFQIAIVDYGEDFSQKLLHSDKQVFGTARARYGLLALNYRNPMEGGRVVYAAVTSDEMTVGRHGGQDLNLDADDYESLKAISREHFTLRVGADGLQVEDTSTNGTKLFRAPQSVYEAVEQGVEESAVNLGAAASEAFERVVEPKIVPELGSVGLKGTLIDTVPQSGQEAEQMLADAKEAQQAERQQKIDQVLHKLEDGMAALMDGLSDADQQNLQLYGSAMLNKADAQHYGRGEESDYYGQVAGQARSGMSELAQSRLTQYLRQRQEIERFNSM